MNRIVRLLVVITSLAGILLGASRMVTEVFAAGVPEECKAADPKWNGGSPDLITYTAPSGKIVTGTCVWLKDDAGQHHTGIIGNGDFWHGCYTISGVGTQTITATRNSSDCISLKHLDLFLGDTEPTPTPTGEPTPTPTPITKEPTLNLTKTDPGCTNSDFKVMAGVVNGTQGTPIKFTYAGVPTDMFLDANGEAEIALNFTNGHTEIAVLVGGFSPESIYINTPTGCNNTPESPEGESAPSPEVLGTSTGQVLGVSTLASTGGIIETVMNSLQLLGTGFVFMGLKRRK